MDTHNPPISTRDLYAQISSLLIARENCATHGNSEWFVKHEESIKALVKQHCPSGSGFDNGTRLDFDASKPERLVFDVDFHHMNDGGFYDGWTEHIVVITPSLAFGFEVTVKGRNRNDIKAHIGETFAQLI